MCFFRSALVLIIAGYELELHTRTETFTVRDTQEPERLSGKQQAFSAMTVQLFQFILEKGWSFTYGEACRTTDQQEWHRRTGRSLVTRSHHQDRRAIDIYLYVNGEYVCDMAKYEVLGEYWKGLHPMNVWGGDWENPHDPWHFQSF